MLPDSLCGFVVLLLCWQLYITTEPVFEIIDLYYSLVFRKVSYARFFAFHKLKRHIETRTPLERFEDPEFRTAYDVRFRTAYDQLESDYFQAEALVSSTGDTWHAWRLAWRRTAPWN